MNKIIIALISLALVATPALAVVAPTGSDIRSSLIANGMTEYTSLATVAGYDWSERSLQTTAMIHEYIKNNDNVQIVSQLVNPGQWILQEGKTVTGSGVTTIDKAVAWWTEDSTVKNGLMKWPTVTSIYVGFQTDTVIDQEEVYNIANQPIETDQGEFSGSQFLKNILTADPFTYVESVGIGIGLDCTPIQPVDFPYPNCVSGC